MYIIMLCVHHIHKNARLHKCKTSATYLINNELCHIVGETVIKLKVSAAVCYHACHGIVHCCTTPAGKIHGVMTDHHAQNPKIAPCLLDHEKQLAGHSYDPYILTINFRRICYSEYLPWLVGITIIRFKDHHASQKYRA